LRTEDIRGKREEGLRGEEVMGSYSSVGGIWYVSSLHKLGMLYVF
jgi:hypothetical protein